MPNFPSADRLRKVERRSYAWQNGRINDVLHRVQLDQILVSELEKSQNYVE